MGVFVGVFGCVFDIERDCDFIVVFVSDFIGVFLLDFIGVFVRDFIGVFVRDFIDVFVLVVLNTSRTFDIDGLGSFFIVIVFDSDCVGRGCGDFGVKEDLNDDEGVRVLNFKSDRKPTGDDFVGCGRKS